MKPTSVLRVLLTVCLCVHFCSASAYADRSSKYFASLVRAAGLALGATYHMGRSAFQIYRANEALAIEDDAAARDALYDGYLMIESATLTYEAAAVFLGVGLAGLYYEKKRNPNPFVVFRGFPAGFELKTLDDENLKLANGKGVFDLPTNFRPEEMMTLKLRVVRNGVESPKLFTIDYYHGNRVLVTYRTLEQLMAPKSAD